MHNLTKYIIATLIIIGLVIFGINLNNYVATGKNAQTALSQPANSKIKIGYVSVAQSLPLYVAQEKGYLKDAGLDAELVKFEAPNLFVDAMVSGQIDASANSLATGIMSIVETKNPGKFKIVGTNYTSPDHAGDVVVIPTDFAATTFADLKGKTCGTLAGPQFKTIFTKLSKDAGLKASLSGTDGDIFYKELPVTELVTGLASKGIDCIVGLEPAGTVAAAKNVGKLLGTSPIAQAMGGRFYGGISAVNSDFATKNPASTKKFIEAIDRATKEIQANEKDSRQYLAKYLNITEPLISNIKLPYFVGSKDIGSEDFKYIDNFLSNFEEQGVYKTKPDMSKLVYNQ
jgi:NitT/TauT family transport system substrate-binding protein